MKKKPPQYFNKQFQDAIKQS